MSNLVCGYDQEIPQSQAADKPMAPWGRATDKQSVIWHMGSAVHICSIAIQRQRADMPSNVEMDRETFGE